MQPRNSFSLTGLLLSAISLANASADAFKSPQFQTLPPLREQAKIVDAWTEKRKALVPGILRKYGVDAWLVRLLRPTDPGGDWPGTTVRKSMMLPERCMSAANVSL